jgi:DNA replication protein DnaC
MQSEQTHQTDDRAKSKLDGWIKKNNYLPWNFYELTEIKFRPEIDADGWKMLANYNEFYDLFGFIFYGNAGVGKSLLMKRLCIRALKLYAPYDYSLNEKIVFMPMAFYMAKVRKNFNETNDFEDRCLDAEFLYLDDIGTEYKTDFANEKLFTLLDYRVSKNLRTFITTNLTISEIKNTYGDRIHSRISELCIPIAISGDDQRKRILANRMQMLLERKKEDCIHSFEREEINQENIDKIKLLLQPKEF